MKPGSLVLLGVGIAAAILIGFLVGREFPKDAPGLMPTPQVDTLVIRDTICVTQAKYVTKRVVDSIPFPVTDTIRLRDTLYVYLEREQVTWEDSLARVYASGVKPQVDSVIYFVQERVITKEIPVMEVKKTRWGIGIQAGVTIGKDGVSPYLGIGGSYNILVF